MCCLGLLSDWSAYERQLEFREPLSPPILEAELLAP
jgi:hypothetical protein